MKPSGSIQNDDIIAVILGKLERFLCNNLGCNLSHFEHLHTGTLTDHLQLIDCGRTIDVTGNQQWIVPLLFQILCQFCCMRSFTGTLQPTHHHNAGRLGRKLNSCIFLAHQLAQFFMYNLNHLLGRR